MLFERAGADAIHVTGWGCHPFYNFTDGLLPDKLGAFLDSDAVIKKAVTIPVIAVGRMLPEVGEKALDDDIDFAAIVNIRLAGVHRYRFREPIGCSPVVALGGRQ